jgi:glutaredoxin
MLEGRLPRFSARGLARVTCDYCVRLKERTEQTTRHYLGLIRLRQFAATECDLDSQAALDACIRNAEVERRAARDEFARHSRYEHGPAYETVACVDEWQREKANKS